MAHITDLRHIDRPTQTVVLDDNTTVHVGPPTVDLVDELREGGQHLFAVLRGEEGSEVAKKAVYEFAAKVINCNDDMLTVTADDLSTKYGLSLKALGVFFNDYVAYLTEIQNEKN